MSGRLGRLGLPATAVAVVAVALGLLPAKGTSNDAGERFDSAQRVVDELTWKIEELSAIELTVQELLETQAEYRQGIPDDHELPEVILDLQAAADASRIELLDIVPTSVLGSFDDAATPIGTSSVVVSVSMRGSFHQTIDVLERFGRLSRLVVVEAVAVGVDDVSGRLAVDVELRVFTTKELVEFTDEFLGVVEGDLTDDPALQVEAG